MNLLKKQWDAEMRSAARRGYTAPFIMVLVGFVYLLLIPYNVDKLEKHKGIIKQYSNDYSKFWLERSEKSYEVDLKKYREKLRKELRKAQKVEVWTKENKNTVMQLKLNGKIVITYKWWNHAKVPLFFILAGLILIPIVIREKKKII
ncbi:hypothetical protein [Anaerophaga thermohalophila]|jgi:hypothetical protein|uniref:hypothetical protein n=1 Tax=Anaerophaga thermohalophila TaxID=177400 RepID=UPI0002EE2664|nr:hypothetical protein [Anaerophaga thermohalophila]